MPLLFLSLSIISARTLPVQHTSRTWVPDASDAFLPGHSTVRRGCRWQALGRCAPITTGVPASAPRHLSSSDTVRCCGGTQTFWRGAYPFHIPPPTAMALAHHLPHHCTGRTLLPTTLPCHPHHHHTSLPCPPHCPPGRNRDICLGWAGTWVYTAPYHTPHAALTHPHWRLPACVCDMQRFPWRGLACLFSHHRLCAPPHLPRHLPQLKHH